MTEKKIRISVLHINWSLPNALLMRDCAALWVASIFVFLIPDYDNYTVRTKGNDDV